MGVKLEEGKACKVCGEFKGFENFYRNTRLKDGRDNRCKECERIRLGYKKTIKRSKVIKEMVNGQEVVSKVCTKCDKLKALADFNDQPDGLLGKESHCKECRAVYRVENKESLSQRAKKYYEENVDTIKWKTSKWYLENYERARERQKDYYESNKEEISVKSKEYRVKNSDKIKKRNRLYYRKNKEQIKVKIIEWRKNNPHFKKVSEHNRMARKRSLPNTFSTEEYEYMMNFFDGKCALTGSEDIQIDHVIPLKIGHAGTVFGNMIPLNSPLNSSKQDKNIFEWFKETKGENNLSEENFKKVIQYLADINNMTCSEYEKYVYECHKNPMITP